MCANKDIQSLQLACNTQLWYFCFCRMDNTAEWRVQRSCTGFCSNHCIWPQYLPYMEGSELRNFNIRKILNSEV